MRHLQQHSDQFDQALNENPMKVVKLWWVIVGVCCIVFSFVASGYFYWDTRLNKTKDHLEEKLKSVEDKVNRMDTTVNVVSVKQDFLQRDIEEIKKNLQELSVNKTYSKKNKVSFSVAEILQK